MPVDDPSDPNSEGRKLRKRVERLEAGTGASAGDSSHPGAGTESLVIGDGAEATDTRDIALGSSAYTGNGGYGIAIGYSSLVYNAPSGIAIGRAAHAEDDNTIALGDGTRALHANSAAIGISATTTASNQIMLGTASETVVVPGTFSNPSARRLKQNIIPAPELVTIFPELFEWEYIARPGERRIGPMADDLIGTDAERFATFDDDGEVAGINKLDLLIAQTAWLYARMTEQDARITELENELRGRNG